MRKREGLSDGKKISPQKFFLFVLARLFVDRPLPFSDGCSLEFYHHVNCEESFFRVHTNRVANCFLNRTQLLRTQNNITRLSDVDRVYIKTESIVNLVF